jgi:hypothetical protein
LDFSEKRDRETAIRRLSKDLNFVLLDASSNAIGTALERLPKSTLRKLYSSIHVPLIKYADKEPSKEDFYSVFSNHISLISGIKSAQQDLRDYLILLDKPYHGRAQPYVTDATYDYLKRTLEFIEDVLPHGSFEEYSEVGTEASEKFGKVRHAVAMLSLGNAFADEDVSEFVGRIRRFLKLADDDELVESRPSRRSTGCRFRFATRTASWCRRPPAATGRKARTSPATAKPLPIFRAR